MEKKYCSQFGQDEYLDKEIFHEKENGFFFDIGAHNGISLSNTYFFEKYRSWDGICVEPIPHIFAQLNQNRKCHKVNGCIAEFNGKAEFLHLEGGDGEFPEMLSGLADKFDSRHMQRIQKGIDSFGGKKNIIEVDCYKFEEILNNYKVNFVDYCSIDVEGNEFNILKSIDFKLVPIDVLTVENNFKSDDVRKYMYANNYKLINNIKCDDVYQLKKRSSFWKFW